MGRSSFPRAARVLLGAVAVVLARSRFLVLVGGLLGAVALWPFLQAYWGKLARPDPAAAVTSGDTEYWCPMCPGVVSAWPAKCPVCFMGLVRRQKADMTPLPDGTLARVQLSPYRVQLAGLRTAPVEYRRLEYEAVVAGRLEADPKGSAAAPGLVLAGDVWDRDAGLLAVGQEGTVSCDAAPGESFVGRVVEVVPGPSVRVRVRVEDPRGDLRPGGYAAATFRTPAAALASARR
ncbi:MAG: efflux RND transporter periplasmic adaptor subunit, partial [Gemmataceae bacterium]|nr:efflux RND transporter periplasmic adaptor subunit [Gemmataceae bacterium]